MLLGTGIGIGCSALVATLPYAIPLLPVDSSSAMIQQLVSWLSSHFPADHAINLEDLKSDSPESYIQAAALGIASVSIVGKEALFRYTL